MEVIKGTLQMDYCLAPTLSQAVVEGDIPLAEGQEDIARILYVSGQVIMGSTQTLSGRVDMEGTVVFNLLYAGADGVRAESVEASCGFTHTLEIPQATPQMHADIQAQVRQVECALSDKRRVSLRAIVDISATLCENRDVQWVTALSDVEGLETLSEQACAYATVCRAQGELPIREDVELPPRTPSISRILRCDAAVRLSTVQAIEQNVLVYGNIALNVLYTCDDPGEPLQQAQFTLPIEQGVSAPGAFAGAKAAAQAQVIDLYASAQIDQSGELRIVQVECIVRTSVQVLEEQSLCVIQDAYSACVPLELTSATHELMQAPIQHCANHSLRETLELPENMPPISRVLSVQAFVLPARTLWQEECLQIEGVVEYTAIYRSGGDDAQLYAFSGSAPFVCALQVPGAECGVDVAARALLEQSYGTAISPSQVDAKFALLFELTNRPSVTMCALVDAQVGAQDEEPAQKSAILIYRVLEGDTLWSVGRKFRVSTKQLVRMNPAISDDKLCEDQNIVLYRRLTPQAPAAAAQK